MEEQDHDERAAHAAVSDGLFHIGPQFSAEFIVKHYADRKAHPRSWITQTAQELTEELIGPQFEAALLDHQLFVRSTRIAAEYATQAALELIDVCILFARWL